MKLVKAIILAGTTSLTGPIFADQFDDAWEALNNHKFAKAVNIFDALVSDKKPISTGQSLYALWGLALAHYYEGDYAQSIMFFNRYRSERSTFHKSQPLWSKLRSENPTLTRKFMQQRDSNEAKLSDGLNLAFYKYGINLVEESDWSSAISNLQNIERVGHFQKPQVQQDLNDLLKVAYWQRAHSHLETKLFPNIIDDISNLRLLNFDRKSLEAYTDSVHFEWAYHYLQLRKYTLSIDKALLVTSTSAIAPEANSVVSSSYFRLSQIAVNRGDYTDAISMLDSSLSFSRSDITKTNNREQFFSRDAVVSLKDSVLAVVEQARYVEASQSNDLVLIRSYIDDYPNNREKIRAYYHSTLFSAAMQHHKNGHLAAAKNELQLIPKFAENFVAASSLLKTIDYSLLIRHIRDDGLKTTAQAHQLLIGVWHSKPKAADNQIEYKYAFSSDRQFASWTRRQGTTWGSSDLEGKWTVELNHAKGGMVATLESADGVEFLKLDNLNVTLFDDSGTQITPLQRMSPKE